MVLDLPANGSLIEQGQAILTVVAPGRKYAGAGYIAPDGPRRSCACVEINNNTPDAIEQQMGEEPDAKTRPDRAEDRLARLEELAAQRVRQQQAARAKYGEHAAGGYPLIT